MLTQVPQPLAYAEGLLATIASLGRAAGNKALLADCVRSVAQLSGCELVQFYLLDVSHTRLNLGAGFLDGCLQPESLDSRSVDYSDEQLLQFALCQNRVLSIDHLGSSLYDTRFLPARVSPWQSLLCVPVINHEHGVEGVLLCASSSRRNLQVFAHSLGMLGTFVAGQLHLLQRARRVSTEGTPGHAPVALASHYGLIGTSAALRRTCQLISKVLHSPYTVLLRGETGTGKEVVARAIHEYGPRRTRAFVVQNCAAFPEHLLESELFGYRKGAFTGADRDRRGLFDMADGGTLLLDEIGDMPLSLQPKLLRVLQEGEIRPLGSNDTHKIDVRIIAATHRDLSVLVSQGQFREDLYYRLAQFPIELPALRHRESDVLELARYFTEKACACLQREPLAWSGSALDYLSGYAFPGNIRELKGQVERAILLCEGPELLAEHFSTDLDVSPDGQGVSLRERMEQIERGLLVDCLRQHEGNQSRVARELGLPRRTLLYRLARLNIQVRDIEI